MDARDARSFGYEPLALEEQLEVEARFQERQLRFAEQLHHQADAIEREALERLVAVAEAEAVLYAGAIDREAALVVRPIDALLLFVNR